MTKEQRLKLEQDFIKNRKLLDLKIQENYNRTVNNANIRNQ